MTVLDLTKNLRGYRSGWVALDKNHKVVFHGKTFGELSEKIKNKKEKLVLLPASENYFGIVT